MSRRAAAAPENSMSISDLWGWDVLKYQCDPAEDR
ncbi:hypothetical protein JMJ77_0007631 [Colletotrichum scovillei]|uniref:Uncharacterized protein n=1 Tax=Colletotrichum scovillei TaxID=1209932 RepID=A0A9P7ULB2_9PEZI|nr:hypothetical protein JMJ77_0007631 [Colletotrichum scovillei]KAG7074581.1 hypothetical protein JMJ76_0011057 [Colletotrichum scovillei]KAG7081612.1 hypothetical protein JMJ78_0003730 [Colletotrichum scovillei]